MVAIGKQHSLPGETARSVMRLSYWLVVLVLGLTSASVAEATPAVREDSLGTEAISGIKSGIKTEVPTAPKPYPSHFPTLTAEGLDERPTQLPAMSSDLEQPTARPPQTSPLPDENRVTDASDLMPETFEISIPDQSIRPTRPQDLRGSEIEFEFPTFAQLTETFGTDPTAFYLANGTDIATSLDVAFTQTDLIAQAPTSVDEIPWRFTFEPFFYLPFGANGDITVRGINAPINAGIGDIFSTIVNDLNFAAFGRVEAWKGTWGIFFSGAYVNVGTGRTADIPVPPILQQVGLPPQATASAATGTSFVQLDLGGAYRFGDGNLPMALRTADTEFDLGPFIFDVLAGVRLYSFNNNLVLTGPRGNQFEFGQSRTVLEPMIGGRARWNLSHNLAVLAGGSLSGFSLGDLTFSAAGYAGIDWLFSGNTSLLASYGFTYLDYSSGNSGLNLFTHGPNIGVKFRF